MIRKSYLFFILFTLARLASSAQPTTALDFNMSDCSTGVVHHLFTELDSGKVVIMEFFMDNCSACVDAGNALEPMYQDLKNSCGNNILYYQTMFNDYYHCGTINNWVTTNGFSSVPFDSGAAQVSYYGGFGMPTVAVAAGNTHQLLYLNNHGFPAADTALVAAAVRGFCSTGAGIVPTTESISSVSVYPVPASDIVTVSFNAIKPGKLKIELENVLGGCIAVLDEETLRPGAQNRSFSTMAMPKGFYLIRILLNDSVFTEKVLIQ